MKRIPWRWLLASALLALSLPRAQSQPYTFSTPIGSAINPGTSDGTNAVAQFTSPKGLALETAGNRLLLDANALRVVSSSGADWWVSTVAGVMGQHAFIDGTNEAVRFNNPQGVAADAGGDIFIADTYNNTIRMVTRSGTNWVVTTIAGPAPQVSPPSGSVDASNSVARFHNPYGITVDSATNLYVADSLNHTIRRITQVGTDWVVTTLAGSAGNPGGRDGTNTDAQFDAPTGIAVDSTGRLYVADFNNNSIREITPMGTNWVVTTLAGTNGVRGSADGLGSAARFYFPQCVALDSSQNLFVTDSGNDTIRKVTPAGFVSTLAGTPGVTGSLNGTGSAVQFNQPYGIVVDAAGRLEVSDFLGYAIRQGQLAALLEINRSAQDVVLSWPMGLTGYGPEYCTSLSLKNWAPLPTGGLILSNEFYFLAVTPGAGAEFFRLRNPSP